MTTPKESILLVDDEEAIRCILNRGLAMRGYLCDEAEDAEQALAKLKVKPVDLVILDINMPGKLGTEVLPEITSRFSETAVIMASGVTDTGIIAQCIKDGAEDYINKPFRFEQVLRSISVALEKRRLETEVQSYFRKAGGRKGKSAAEPRRLFLGAIETLVNSLESGDSYTTGHSQRVAEFALGIGRKLGLDREELDDLYWASLLHDVGKIAVDPNILNKPGELTPGEYRHIMTHAVVGPRLVEPFVNERVVSIISHHHDHYDGGGLEQSIRGQAIPLGARIVAVADAFQAMTSDRPYRRALPLPEALEEIKWHRGSQFDPAVADIMIDSVREKFATAQPAERGTA